MHDPLLRALSRTVHSFNSRDVVKAVWAIQGLRLQVLGVRDHLLQTLPAIAPVLTVRHLNQAVAGVEWLAMQAGSEEKLQHAQAAGAAAKKLLPSISAHNG